MEEEIKKVITIEVNGDHTVKSLKQEINDLRDALLNTEKGSEDYQKILEQLIEDQKKYTDVMSAGKKEATAAAGSYNALQQEMTALKKVWKEVTDEASRDEIGVRIKSINDQLKDMDATIGNHQRNVGNYAETWLDAGLQMSSSFGKMNSILRTIQLTTRNLTKEMAKLTAQQKAYNVAAQATGGAMDGIGKSGGNAAKGFGKMGSAAGKANIYLAAAVAILSLVITYWDDILDLTEKISPKMKKQSEEIKTLTDKNKELVKTLDEENNKIEFQARIMEAQGRANKEVLEYKKQETEALLENIKAQVAETEAKIASLKAHSWWQRTFSKDKKHIKELEESLEELKTEEENYTKTITKLTQDIVIDGINKENERVEATRKAAEERLQIEKNNSKERLAEIQRFVNEAKRLEEQLYTDEEKIAANFAKNQQTVINGLFGGVVQAIRRKKLPDEIKRQFDGIDLASVSTKLSEQINDIISALDLTKSDFEIADTLKTKLKGIDLSEFSKDFQTKFSKAINNINISSVTDEFINKIEDTINSADIDTSISLLKEMFVDDEEMTEVLDSYFTLWNRVQEENDKKVKENIEKNKKENANRVKDNLDALKQDKANKLAYFKEEIEAEKERAREIFDTDKATYDDRLALRQAEYEADRKYADLEIQTLQEELDEYRRVIAEEELDDNTFIAFKQEITDKEIELIRKLREERDKEREKQKKDAEDEKEEILAKIDGITQFANAVGSILGSVSDYWLEMLNTQVENGKKSEEEAEKEFNRIKALQIAEATISTIAGAIGAFMKANETYAAPWGAIIGAAQAAAVTATGIAQIAKIKNTQYKKNGGTSDATASGAKARIISTDFTPEYVAAQTGASETTNLANAMAQQNLWVSVTDINRVQNKVSVREQESQW